MRVLADFSTQPSPDGGTTLVFHGPLVVSSIGALDRRLRALPDKVNQIDLGEVQDIDTIGAWVVWRFSRENDAKIVSPCKAAERLIDAVRKADDNREAIRKHRAFLPLRVADSVGASVIDLMHGALRVIGLLGQVIIAIGATLRQPSRFRGLALVSQMEQVGVSSLAIIGLMSFLIGIVIAQQGAVQLRQFGAEIYTVNLVGRLTLRELGVLMTAIMVAGRSGSAFAAQLGTMKLTEEIDAMRTIGVSPIEALVLPRMLACIFMMPLLGVYSSAVAIVGGAFLSSLTLGIPFWTFLARIQEVVPSYDLWVGLIKALVFGTIVSVAGCYQGLQVEGNAEEVGRRTTAAVVMAIFIVIVLDAFFAVFFSNVGWG